MSVLPNSNADVARYRNLLNQVGRKALHSLFPRDFEAYFISMELTDSKGVTEAFITFPVQPDQISEVSTRITNVKKTASGVVAIGTESFVPIDIEIKGNFGRQMRFVIGNKSVNGNIISFVRNAISGQNVGYVPFSNSVKTGYGMIKELESLVDSADTLDLDGKPKRLYLYNTILGNNYLVKPKNFVHSQNTGSNNMLPMYTLQLTAVAPLNASGFGQIRNLGKSMAMSTLNKGADALAKSIKGKLGL